MPEPFTYLLPIRLPAGDPPAELTAYLYWVSQRADLLIVDGSQADAFEQHRLAWGSFARHVRPSPESRCLNGKAWGVRSGMSLPTREIVVLADDDVRYTAGTLAAVTTGIGDGDLLRPQNYFDPAPWHAAWDTGRIILNRAFGFDHPGTFVIRRSTYTELGGYDGDVLFENLELVRTFEAGGARIVERPDLYVQRLPPTTAHFWSQRVRQAYDDLAQPWRFVRLLLVVPAVAVLVRRPRLLFLAAAATVTAAELGRRRAGGSAFFRPVSSLLSLAWLLERGLCSWIALWLRMSGKGCGYAGEKIFHAATPVRVLRRRVHT